MICVGHRLSEERVSQQGSSTGTLSRYDDETALQGFGIRIQFLEHNVIFLTGEGFQNLIWAKIYTVAKISTNCENLAVIRQLLEMIWDFERVPHDFDLASWTVKTIFGIGLVYR